MSIYKLISGNNQQTFSLDAQGPKASPKEAWKLDNFEAKSAPFVFDRVLYISKEKSLVAIESATGKTKWEVQIPGQASAPTIVDDLLIFGGNYIDNHLYGVDKETGKEVFKFRTGTEMSGVHNSPVVEDGKIIFAAGKTVYALDLLSKKVAWRLKTAERIDYSPVTIGNGGVFKTTFNGSKSKLYGASISDGSEICKIPLKIRCSSPLLYQHERLFYVDHESNLNIVEPDLQTIQSIKVMERESHPYFSYLAYKDGHLIIGIGHTVVSFNLNSWNWDWVFHSKGAIGQPVIADGIVYFATCFDGIYGLDFNTGKKLFQINTDVRSQYSCAIEGGSLFMAGSMNEHQLIAYK